MIEVIIKKEISVSGKPTYEELMKRIDEYEQESAENKQIIKSLLESEKQYRLLVDNTHDVPYSVTPEGIVNFIGPQVRRFGQAPEEVISRHYLDFVVPEQRETVRKSFEQGTQNRSSLPTEFQWQGKDGFRYWVEAVGQIICDDSGQPVIQIGVLRDTSQRRTVRKKREESYYMLKKLIDTVDGEAFVKDSKGTYLFVNRAFGKVFDVDPKEVIGKDDYFVFAPEIAAMLQKNDQQIMTGKKAVSIKESAILRGKHTTYLTNKVPLIGDDGSIMGICGVGLDITHNEKLEKDLKEAKINLERRIEERTAELSETVDNLREAELRYRTVANFTYDWEYWTNLDGSLEYVSPSCERISGYTTQQFMDKPSLNYDIIIPEDREIWKKHFHDSRQKPKARDIQFRIQNRDGSIRWIEHVCQPVWDGKGEVVGFRASNRDITKRRKRVTQLQKAYSEIEELKEQLEADQTYLREEIKLEHDYDRIIGDSDIIKSVLFKVEQIAPTETTVLILGETGTGKELITRAIHNASQRKARPLIKVDCASLPANLIVSELFGHEKGAFTGAVEKRIGRFELANGSTLFLDEIGDLPKDTQSKLLRILEYGEFERVGSSQTLYSDIRVIAATNRNLEEDVSRGQFREDLYYRLNVLSLSIPPLRKRVDDIPLLVNWIIGITQRRFGKHIKVIPNEVMAQLMAYSWPGNIRELENVLERAVIFSQNGTLRLVSSLKEETLMMDSPPPNLPMKSLVEMEKEYILRALNQTYWNISGKGGAADLLGINSSTLRGRMRKHGIRRPHTHS